MSIQERFEKVQTIIRQHVGEANVPAVTVVAVTKYAELAQMEEAYQAGLRHFGENKVQDALLKMEHFPPERYPGLHWHLIGPLQSNKVKKTVGRFSLLHAVDSQKLAEAMAAANEAAGRCQAVLLQINLSEDPTRHGLLPDQALPMLQGVLGRKGIAVRGLMTMAPPEASLNDDIEALQYVFSGLRELRDSLAHACQIALPELSMGMTHDFPHALDSGATIIRIGNYLFKN